MRELNKTILIFASVLLILDYIYISVFSKYFKNQVYKVQKKPLQMNIKTTILCYLLLIIGVYYFIIKENRTVLDSFLFGILIYGVYELTTISLLSDWDYKTVFIDTIWGGILISSSVYLTRKIY